MPADPFSAADPDALVVASGMLDAVRRAGGLVRAHEPVVAGLRSLTGWPTAHLHAGPPFPAPLPRAHPSREAAPGVANLVAAVLRAGEPVRWSTAAGDPDPPAELLAGDRPARAALAVPVRGARGMVAVLAVVDAVARPHDARLVARLEALAHELGTADDAAVASGALAEELQRRDRVEHVTQAGTWELDLHTGALVLSPELRRLAGGDQPPPTTIDAVELLVEDDRADALAFAEDLRRGVIGAPRRWRSRQPDGATRWVELRAFAVEGGRAWGTVRDATREVEDARRHELRQTWSALVEEMAHVASWELDVAAGTVVWSPEYYRIVGQDPATFEPTLANIARILHPDDVAIIAESIETEMAGGRVGPSQLRYIRPDGEVRWVDAHGRTLDRNRMVGYVQDVTEKHRAEQQRRMHTHILDNLDVSLVVVDPAPPGRLLYLNPRAAAAYGSDVDTLMHEGIEALAESGGEDTRRAVREVIATGEPWHGDVAVVLQGERRVAQLSVSTVQLPEIGPAIVLIGRDVTVARRNEAALRASEEQARVIMTHAPIGMVIADPDGRVLEANDAMRAMLRLPNAPVAEFELMPRSHPDDLASHLAAVESVIAGERDAAQLESRVRRGDGTWMWALSSVSAIRDDHGRPILLVGQVVDISDRRAAEEQLRRTAEELREASQAKTRFMSRMSHELRTPLNAVLGYAQLLSLETLRPDQQEAVGHVLHAGQHLLELIDEVLDITSIDSGGVPLVLRDLDLRTAISEALRLVGPMADAHRIALVVDLATAQAETPVVADRRRLTQVLVNLLTNGIKYNRPGGQVSIAAEQHGSTVQVSVRDTGRGISADGLRRVFEPFERLGAEQLGIDGTGIGLPLARSLVEHMGGTLAVSSTEQVGTTFTLTLRAGDGTDLDGAVTTPPPGLRLDLDPRRDLVVLSIEDNEVNERLIEAIVRLRPHVRLHHAVNGRLAIELAAELRPDLVLLDLHLPDVRGTEVLATLRRAEGRDPVVAVVSADASPDQITEALALGADRYLTKPVDVAEVLALLDEVAAAAPDRSPDQLTEGHRP